MAGRPKSGLRLLASPDCFGLGLLVDQQWNWRENQALGRRLKNVKLRTNACVEDIDYRGARGLDNSVSRALVQASAWGSSHEKEFSFGPAGAGKTFVPSALPHKATRTTYPPLLPRPP